MNIDLSRHLPPPAHLSTMQPAPLSPQSGAPARPGQEAPAASVPSGTRFTPTPIFNFMANVMRRDGAGYFPLSLRRARTQQRDAADMRNARLVEMAAAEESGLPGEEDALSPVDFTIDQLRQGDGRLPREHLEEEFEKRGYDPLQRFNIYLEAAQNTANLELGRREARKLKVALKALMAEIFKKNRHEIRRLLHEEDELEAGINAILGAQSANAAAVTRRELRFLLGPGRARVTRDRVDVPLKALSVLRFLIRNAGPEGCLKVLPAYRAHWKSEY